mmetsp:Transcript_49041/g.87443  ORF Transcript_49041/g.87443 Transcript_49041/m.87443 type:complete len:212 (+) Transcript_49041:1668-2303(+)
MDVRVRLDKVLAQHAAEGDGGAREVVPKALNDELQRFDDGIVVDLIHELEEGGDHLLEHGLHHLSALLQLDEALQGRPGLYPHRQLRVAHQCQDPVDNGRECLLALPLDLAILTADPAGLGPEEAVGVAKLRQDVGDDEGLEVVLVLVVAPQAGPQGAQGEQAAVLDTEVLLRVALVLGELCVDEAQELVQASLVVELLCWIAQGEQQVGC